MQNNSSQTIPTNLYKEWGIYIIGSITLIGGIFTLLQRTQPSSHATQWAVQTLFVLLILVISNSRRLADNHRADEMEILPTLGSGTWLTLARSTLIATVCGFYFLPQPEKWAVWLPAILYTTAAVTDFFDGWLARITNHSTILGQQLDMDMDSIGILSITFLIFQYGKIPWWYLLFGSARYIFLLGIWIRKRQGKPIGEMQNNVLRRWLAALQMGFIATIAYPLLGPPATRFAASIFMIPFAGSFIYDWLHIIQHDQKKYFKLFFQFGRLLHRKYSVIALTTRISIAALISFWLLNNQIPATFIWVFISLSVLLLSGTTVRIAAILTLIFAGLMSTTENFNWTAQLLLSLNLLLCVFGSGKFSLWNPEEWLIWNRAGD